MKELDIPLWMVHFTGYCIVGGINTAADLVVFLLLTADLQMPPEIANVASYTVGILVSFALNKNFTFRTSRHALRPSTQLVRFIAINLVSLLGSTSVIWLLSNVVSPVAAKIVTIPLVIAWGFLSTQGLVFQAMSPGRSLP
jgi:putative flippase GtrA